MKLPSRVILAALIASHLGLAGCSTVRNVGQNSVDFMTTTAKATSTKVASLSEQAVNRISPPKVSVVTVRQKDLKKQLSGQDRVIAFENTRKRGMFSFFSGPVNFKEPAMPLPGGEIDGSLLPPREN
jgi:outer membrane murein-binding lipoprotein Lpp